MTTATATATQRRMYIDGKWCDADNGRTLGVLNPATEEVLAEVAYGGRAETRRAPFQPIPAIRPMGGKRIRHSVLPKWQSMIDPNSGGKLQQARRGEYLKLTQQRYFLWVAQLRLLSPIGVGFITRSDAIARRES